MSESESSSDSVPELEELSGEELLSWLPGPLPFSSEALQHVKRESVSNTCVLGTTTIGLSLCSEFTRRDLPRLSLFSSTCRVPLHFALIMSVYSDWDFQLLN